MPGEFDMDGALDTISNDLFSSGDLGGSGDGSNGDDLSLGGDDDLSGGAPAGKPAASPIAKGGDSGAADPGDGTGAPGAEPVNKETTPPADGATPPTAEGPKPPTSWSKEAQASFATLPPHVQAEVEKREQDFHKGIEVYKQDANFGKTFQKVLEPHMALIQHHNINPFQMAQGLFNAHVRLTMGTPAEKTALMRQIIKDYQIDPEALTAEEAYEPPEVKALREENQRLQSESQNARNAATAATQRILSEQIDKFEADPKNAYFKDVINDMIPLLKEGLSLEAAYERAVWANPVTRAREQARIATESSAAKAKEEADRVAVARKATSANVRTSAKGGSATAPLGSMDDTMKETLQAIKSRG